jgi:ABC-type lipopolysaccharide export system ATPase subunit
LAAQTFAAGLNYFIQGHNAKLTLDVQNRPVFSVNNGAVASDGRKNQVTMQYQIFF